MIFNKFKKLILIPVVLLVGCSDFLKGKPKPHPYIEAQSAKLACLKEIPTQIKVFLKSEATNQDVDLVFGCIDQALLEVQAKVDGEADKNALAAEDLFSLFNTFLKDANISKQATIDILKLKSAILGGSSQRLTKAEVTLLRDFLKSFKTEVHLLLPYAELYNFKKASATSKYSKATIAAAFKQLGSSLNKILQASQIAKSDYEFEDFKNLFLDLKLFENSNNDLFDLALEVKNLLCGSEPLKSTAEFQNFIDNLTEILRLYSLQSQGYVVFEIKDRGNMQEVVEFVEGWVKTLENSVQFKRTKLISVETLDPLIRKVANKNILPVNVKPDTLASFYKTIIVRAFEAGPGVDPQSFTGLKRIHFVNIRREIALFKGYLSFINSLPYDRAAVVDGAKRIKVSEIQEHLRNFDFSKVDSFKDVEKVDQSWFVNSLKELASEFLLPRPMIYRFNKVVLAANQEIWDQSWDDLVRGMYGKFLGRELIIGWGNAGLGRSVEKSFITEDGLVQWYREFKTFGIEVKLFDDRFENSGAKSFKEANLFTFAGNGDDKMNFNETVQYLNLLISGGGESFNQIKDGFAEARCNLKDLDKDNFGNYWNDESCAYLDLKANYKRYFNNLSYLVTYLNSLNETEFRDFYTRAMTVARYKSTNAGRLETADIRNMTILLHYIESLFAEYDKDRNFSFSAQEIRTAYPRFKIFATDYAMKTSKDKIDLYRSLSSNELLGYSCYPVEAMIRESFIFLVFNGTTPGISDFTVTPCFRAMPLIQFEGEVDRKTILNTFKILKAVLGS